MSGNDIVCIVLKGAESLHGRKIEKNLTLALSMAHMLNDLLRMVNPVYLISTMGSRRV
jgi:hypothetical protein